MAQTYEISFKGQVSRGYRTIKGRISNGRLNLDMDAQKHAKNLTPTLQSQEVTP